MAKTKGMALFGATLSVKTLEESAGFLEPDKDLAPDINEQIKSENLIPRLKLKEIDEKSRPLWLLPEAPNLVK